MQLAYIRRSSHSRPDRGMDRLDAAAAALTDAEQAIDPPSIEWENDTPEAVNAVLRALSVRIRLDANLHPIAVDWRVPEWVA